MLNRWKVARANLISATSVRSYLAGVLSFIRPHDITEYSSEVAVEQAVLLAKLCPLYAAFGTMTVLLLVAEFESRLSWAGMAAAVALPGLYAALLLQTRQLRSDRTSTFLTAAVRLLVFIGLAWGVLVFDVAAEAMPEQKNLVGALIIGLLSTPIMTVPFTAAAAFLFPFGLAALLTFLVEFRPLDIYLVSCFMGYFQFAYVSTVLLNRFSLERTVARLRLQHQNEITTLFLKNYKENATDWAWEVDSALRLRNISRRFAAALRTIPLHLRRAELRALAESEIVSDLGLLIDRFDRRLAFRDIVIRMDAEDGPRWWAVTGQPIYDSNAHFSGYRGIASDITERRRSESRTQFLANHDVLTGLPNRARFASDLDRLCLLGLEEAALPFALLLLDLDCFKDVNDTHGHPFGDALLIAVAERLRRALRSSDTAYRLGGDEFAVLVSAADPDEVAAVATRLADVLQEPYMLNEVIVHPSASIGFTFGPHDGGDAATLMRNADLALYRAKSDGRGVWRRYRDGMEEAHIERTRVTNDLRTAEEADFEIDYQIVVDLATLQISGAEALVRWNRRGHGIVGPADFIPVAEDAGLINVIGAMVLERSCQAAAGWPGRTKLAVNVSALQFQHVEFLSVVERVLAVSGLDPSRLELELTEGVLLAEDDVSSRTIRELRQMGIGVVLDDFGTGYSSLAALIRFPFSGVKLDAGFISSIEADRRARSVVRATALIAADLALPVTAEGVETRAQLELLAGYGIQLGQGYLFGRPQNGAMLACMLAAGPLGGLGSVVGSDSLNEHGSPVVSAM